MNESIVKSSIESFTIDKSSIDCENNLPALGTKESASIEYNAIDAKTIENTSIVQEDKKASPLVGIHPTSIRAVREELLKALAGLMAAEVKIGDITPLTGLTRRTVDRVCRHLEKSGEFTFERQHRGMKVTNLQRGRT